MTSLNKEFKCLRCGRCCGIIPFTKPEYKKVRKIAKRMRITFVKVYVKNKPTYFIKKLFKEYCKIADLNPKDIKRDYFNEKCSFFKFDDDKKAYCSIYEYRPEVCKEFGSGEHKYLICPNNINKSVNNNEKQS